MPAAISAKLYNCKIQVKPAMSSAAILIIFCAIGFCSIVAVSLVNQRQRRTKVMRQKLNHMRRRVNELEDLVTAIDALVESRAIARLVNDEVINLLRAMLQLDHSAGHIQASLNAAENRATDLSQEGQDRQLNRLQESDAQIARAQHQLTEAGRVLRRQHAKGNLSIEELDVFSKELSWAYLLVGVISTVAQGHKALNRGNVVNAHAFYKKAQFSLTQSQHADPRRYRLIKEIGDLLQRRRRFLSPDLMPETQYNPPETVPAGSNGPGTREDSQPA